MNTLRTGVYFRVLCLLPCLLAECKEGLNPSSASLTWRCSDLRSVYDEDPLQNDCAPVEKKKEREREKERKREREKERERERERDSELSPTMRLLSHSMTISM